MYELPECWFVSEPRRMEQDHGDFLSQPEILSFERRLMEVVHELNMKRVSIRAVRTTFWFDTKTTSQNNMHGEIKKKLCLLHSCSN